MPVLFARKQQLAHVLFEQLPEDIGQNLSATDVREKSDVSTGFTRILPFAYLLAQMTGRGLYREG